VIRDSIGEKQVEQTELINKEINVVIKWGVLYVNDKEKTNLFEGTWLLYR
jgi:hypothetical protein